MNKIKINKNESFNEINFDLLSPLISSSLEL